MYTPIHTHPIRRFDIQPPRRCGIVTEWVRSFTAENAGFSRTPFATSESFFIRVSTRYHRARSVDQSPVPFNTICLPLVGLYKVTSLIVDKVAKNSIPELNAALPLVLVKCEFNIRRK